MFKRIFDPDVDQPRKPNMLDPNADAFIDDTAAVAVAELSADREQDSVDLDDTELSEQTVWMLAIRDKRDRSAFAKLFDYYAPRLKAMAMRGGARAEQAEDIVQEVMLTVWHKAAQFDPHRAQVSAWVYRIARNRQVDFSRKEGRPIPEPLKCEEPPEDDAGQVLALEQEVEKLKAALSRLKPDQREMIEKAYMGELSHNEISRESGVALGTIKSRIRLGLDRLRHELKELR